MVFTTPLALILLLLLPLIAYVGWPRIAYRRRRDIASLVIRLVIVAMIVFSLAGLHVTQAAEKLAVVFLVDVSDSMGVDAQAAAQDYVRAAMAASGPDDETAVVLFGGNALVERPMLSGTELGAVGSTPTTLNTDLAEAIRLGTALFPADAAKRMVILSDGVVTVGDAAEAARLATASGVQIDFVPFSRVQTPEVAVTDVQVPVQLNIDEPFEINYTIESDVDTDALVTLLVGGQTIARAQVALEQGDNRYFFRLDEGFPATGFSDIRVQVEPLDPATDDFYQNNRLSAFTEIEGPSKVLMVTQDNADGLEAIEHLLPGLEEVGLEIDVVTPDALPIGLAPLTAYSSVMLVNVPASDLSPMRMEVLRSYVRDLGGGLVAIGGDESFGVGGYYRTPLEDMLPVEMQLRDQERLPALTLLFVIDTSGSMGSVGPSGYSNIDLAKEAIIRSIDLLNPVDRVGVVGFDTNASWVVPTTQLDNPGAVSEMVATLRAGGGTDILAGLRAAENYLPEDPSMLKHVILLSDGGSNPSGILASVENMRVTHDATTSVVAIGEDFNPFLQDVAQMGQGNFHLARDVSTIPAIFTAETVLATRSYIVEEEFFASQTAVHPIMTGISRVPPLQGYVATSPKENAIMLMAGPQPNSDPLLAAWQFGLGRSVAWTSDATAKWGASWVTWEDYARFFSQMVRWTITEGVDSSLEARVEQRGEEAVLIVDARDREGNFLNGLLLDAGLVSPDLTPQNVTLHQVAPGRYEGVFAPGEEGAYFIRIAGEPLGGSELAGLSVAQTAGWVLTYSPEYNLPESGADLDLLNTLANLSGGRSLIDSPDAVYLHNITASNATLPLWPFLLLTAAILLPFDVGVRRLIITRSDWRKFVAWLREKLGMAQPVVVPERSDQMNRLMGAKQRARPEDTPIRGSLPTEQPSAVDAVLPTDERKSPTPTRPEAPASPSGQTAASLVARKRATRDQPAAPETPKPAPSSTPEPGSQRKPARPKPKPAPPPEEGSTASQLLRRKRQQRSSESDDEDS